MKKLIPGILLLAIAAGSYAQGVSKMFGLVAGLPQQSQASNGFLFSTDSTGNNFQVKYNFPVTTFGGNPGNLEMIAYNGKLYGTTSTGGTNNYGTIFEYDPATNIYTKKFDFGPNVAASGGSPKGSLLLYNNKFYGLAADYAVYGTGCIFEWDPATNIYVKKYDFIPAGGANPQNSLRLMNGKMYGTTLAGGAGGLGVVFEWDPATNNYMKLLDLTGTGAGTNGWGFYNNVTPYNNRLYCTTVRGGINDYGTLLRVDPSLPVGSNTVIIKHFDASSGGNGNNNEMIVYNNMLYGCLYAGGGNGHGTLFSLDPVFGNTFNKLVDFNYSVSGANPQGKLLVNGSKLLGMCSSGGVNGTGTVFEWNPASPGIAVKKGDFGPSNFDNPVNPGSTLTFFNAKFYGVTNSSGFVNQGTLFEYDYATTSIVKKLTFNAAENGRIPYGKPVLLNGKLYGTSYQGPQEIFGTPYGCIWQFDPSTSVYSRKFIFSNVSNADKGRAPVSAPIAYNGKLYGTTSNGGIADVGILYEFDPVTDIFTKKDMQSIAGSFPISEPTVYGGKLYGMTNANGAGNTGIIYSYDIASGTLAKVADIQGSGSLVPSGGFTVYNNKLYGATPGGGANNSGGIVVFDPANNSVNTVASFSTALGVSVSNAPTLYNGKFYLTAAAGGTAVGARGTIMQFDPATNALTKIYDFTSTPGGNGYDPRGELTVSGDKLYVMSQEGGGITNVLELNPATNTVIKKSTYTSSAYNVIGTHNGLTVVPAFIANGIANNCETYPTVVINASNNNRWVPILNTADDVVAEIKANGNNLGNVNAGMYINNGAVREDGQHRLYLDRNITITVQNTSITGNVDLRLYIKKSEYDSLKAAVNSLGQPSGIHTINDVAVYKNNESCDAAVNNPSAKLATIAGEYEYGYVLAVSVNSFSTFYFANSAYTTLPVNLVSFTAKKENKKVALKWETSSEINTSSYEIERSTDGRNFELLFSRNALHGSTNRYDATDSNPVKGYNYYRLKMVDADRSFTYSNVVPVYFDENLSLSIWPNPASSYITIPEAKLKDRIRIVDAKGAVVLSMIISNQNQQIPISRLPAGIYQLQLLNDQTILQSRFMKH